MIRSALCSVTMSSARSLARPTVVLVAGLLAGGGIMLGLTGYQPHDPSPGSRRGIDATVIGVAANSEMLFRVYSDGSVDYLRVSTEACNKYPNGVPDWALFKIDHKMTHDLQGHPQPKKN